MGQKIFNGKIIIDDAGKTTLESAKIGALNGVLKGNAGDVEAAVADTDYQQPVTWGDGLEYSSGTAGVDYTDNLKITAGELDTAQGIKTTDSPTFANVVVNNTPTQGTHATNKDYVDAAMQGGKRKDNCLVATTANIALSGEQTIDEVLTSSSRVLVKNQTDQKQNGIYVSATGAWTRATDADTGTEILGALIKILQGTVSSGSEFQNSNSTAPTLGTDNVTFVDLGTIINHNDTGSKQGGTASEYYHLTSAQHTKATQNASGSQDGLLAQADWSTFNGKEDVLTAGNGLARTGDTLDADYTDNLKITGGQLDTIQPIKTTSDVTFNKATISTIIVQGGLTTRKLSQALADDAELTIEAGTVGFGSAQIGDNEEWADFCWTAAGVVTLKQNSTNVTNTDTDGNLCVYDAGSQIAIKNRLGSSKIIRFEVSYS